eukprot:TRINITY_DN1402_c0_g1_i7.p1 TRINITY_DN1402_c0_g1~~TRINITY_DN1402_c0_g1_i7.p1  ORF type:complete len:440 (-),score=71.53 TRINITY_DN1402_c0_g1_i7:257-1438(-)
MPGGGVASSRWAGGARRGPAMATSVKIDRPAGGGGDRPVRRRWPLPSAVGGGKAALSPMPKHPASPPPPVKAPSVGLLKTPKAPKTPATPTTSTTPKTVVPHTITPAKRPRTAAVADASSATTPSPTGGRSTPPVASPSSLPSPRGGGVAIPVGPSETPLFTPPAPWPPTSPPLTRCRGRLPSRPWRAVVVSSPRPPPPPPPDGGGDALPSLAELSLRSVRSHLPALGGAGPLPDEFLLLVLGGVRDPGELVRLEAANPTRVPVLDCLWAALATSRWGDAVALPPAHPRWRGYVEEREAAASARLAAASQRVLRGYSRARRSEAVVLRASRRLDELPGGVGAGVERPSPRCSASGRIRGGASATAAAARCCIRRRSRRGMGGGRRGLRCRRVA